MTFEAPIWLIITPLVVAGLVLFFVITEIRKKNKVSTFVGGTMASSLAKSYSLTKRNTKAVLFTMSAALCCLALARPQLGSTYIEEQRKGVDFIIALDVSKSMLAEDIKPNRLERAKLSILDLLENVKGDRVGLVAFAGSAFLQCPLTLDYDAFQQTLDSVNTEILSTQGTDIAGALREAEASFAKDNNHKVLVMMTDGEDLEAEGILQAKKAKESGLTIYTIGVGQTEGELIPVKDEKGKYDWLKDPAGNLVRTKLDEQTLKEIAIACDGIYVPLGATGEGLQIIYEHCLSDIPAQERETRLQQVPIERYQWPLALAIGCWIVQSMLGSRKSLNGMASGTLAVSLLITFSPDTSYAFTFDEGRTLFDKGKYDEAGEYYREKANSDPENSTHFFNEGLAQLRNDNFEAAESAFSEALKLEIDNPVFQSEIYEALAITKFEHGRELSSSDNIQTVERWKQSQFDFNSARNLAASNDSKRKESLQHQQTLVEERLKNLIYTDGVSKYKEKDYEGAASSFDQAFQYSTPDDFDEIHYNQGNCKYRIGESQLETNPSDTVKTWEKALENYDEAIKLRNDSSFPQAERNREILLKRLKQLKERLEQQKQESQDQDKSQDSDPKEKEPDKENSNQSDQSQENKNSESENQSGKSEEQNESSGSQEKNDSQDASDIDKSKKQNGEEDNETGKTSETGKDEKPEEEAKVLPGRMTREQAAQLLQQLKTYERKLPLGNLEHIRKKEKRDNREGRNW